MSTYCQWGRLASPPRSTGSGRSSWQWWTKRPARQAGQAADVGMAHDSEREQGAVRILRCHPVDNARSRGAHRGQWRRRVVELSTCVQACNLWKRDRTALEWLIDQKLHREQPTVGFDTRRMPMRMFHGFQERIARTRREIGELAAGTGSVTTTAAPATRTRRRCWGTCTPAWKSSPAIPISRGRRRTSTRRQPTGAQGTCAAVTGTRRQGVWTR